MNHFRLSDGVRQALESVPVACIITEVDHKAELVVKLDRATIEGFRGAVPIKYRYELGRFDSGAVICLALEVLDDPRAPYSLETFLNVASEYDLPLARNLQERERLILHFLDENLEYQYSKSLKHRRVNRNELRGLVDMALAHNATLPKVDFAAARRQFMLEVKR